LEAGTFGGSDKNRGALLAVDGCFVKSVAVFSFWSFFFWSMIFWIDGGGFRFVVGATAAVDEEDRRRLRRMKIEKKFGR